MGAVTLKELLIQIYKQKWNFQLGVPFLVCIKIGLFDKIKTQ